MSYQIKRMKAEQRLAAHHNAQWTLDIINEHTDMRFALEELMKQLDRAAAMRPRPANLQRAYEQAQIVLNKVLGDEEGD